MRCPVDKSDMIVVEHRKIELDYCLDCAGVWLDSGELDLMILALKAEGAKLSNSELFKPQAAKDYAAKRKCPICGRNMDIVRIGDKPEVLIDSCPLGDGIWFDGGELKQVLCTIEPERVNDIISFLGSAFEGNCQSQIEKK